MLSAYHRAANDEDIGALASGRGSLWRNLVTLTLPTAVLIFVIVYAKWRSLAIAAAVSTGLLFLSALSNFVLFSQGEASRATEVELLRDRGARSLGFLRPRP